MLPLPTEEQVHLLNDAKGAYESLFPAIKAAVRLGSDGEVFNITHRNESKNKSLAMWTRSILNGTLEEVAALYLDQSDHVTILLDSTRSHRLYELQAPSIDKPLHSAAMRWSLWRPPSKLLDSRDICFLEYMESSIDSETGRRVWARGIRSINHLCCPASQHPDGPIRTHVRVSGMIFRETDRPNVLERLTFLHMDSKNVPSWALHQVFAAHKKAADNLNHVLKIMRQQTPRQAIASSGSDSSESQRPRDCKACGDHISKWTIAKHCRFCHTILCRKCAAICYYCSDTSGKNHRMCLTCASDTKLANRTGNSYNALHSKHRKKSTTHAQSASIFAERNVSEGRKTSECKRFNTSTGTNDTNSSWATRLQFVKQDLRQRAASHQNLRVPAQSLEHQPTRAEPIDLSYLNELVTPRARTTTRAVDKE
ncbi:uncharacterized protein CCR75_002652 [Bremia lactucae]|nr:hypothetical protein CCR75_002652 [Bremia lactucae]